MNPSFQSVDYQPPQMIFNDVSIQTLGLDEPDNASLRHINGKLQIAKSLSSAVIQNDLNNMGLSRDMKNYDDNNEERLLNNLFCLKNEFKQSNNDSNFLALNSRILNRPSEFSSDFGSLLDNKLKQLPLFDLDYSASNDFNEKKDNRLGSCTQQNSTDKRPALNFNNEQSEHFDSRVNIFTAATEEFRKQANHPTVISPQKSPTTATNKDSQLGRFYQPKALHQSSPPNELNSNESSEAHSSDHDQITKIEFQLELKNSSSSSSDAEKVSTNVRQNQLQVRPRKSSLPSSTILKNLDQVSLQTMSQMPSDNVNVCKDVSLSLSVSLSSAKSQTQNQIPYTKPRIINSSIKNEEYTRNIEIKPNEPTETSLACTPKPSSRPSLISFKETVKNLHTEVASNEQTNGSSLIATTSTTTYYSSTISSSSSIQNEDCGPTFKPRSSAKHNLLNNKDSDLNDSVSSASLSSSNLSKNCDLNKMPIQLASEYNQDSASMPMPKPRSTHKFDKEEEEDGENECEKEHVKDSNKNLLKSIECLSQMSDKKCVENEKVKTKPLAIAEVGLISNKNSLKKVSRLPPANQKPINLYEKQINSAGSSSSTQSDEDISDPSDNQNNAGFVSQMKNMFEQHSSSNSSATQTPTHSGLFSSNVPSKKPTNESSNDRENKFVDSKVKNAKNNLKTTTENKISPIESTSKETNLNDVIKKNNNENDDFHDYVNANYQYLQCLNLPKGQNERQLSETKRNFLLPPPSLPPPAPPTITSSNNPHLDNNKANGSDKKESSIGDTYLDDSKSQQPKQSNNENLVSKLISNKQTNYAASGEVLNFASKPSFQRFPSTTSSSITGHSIKTGTPNPSTLNKSHEFRLLNLHGQTNGSYMSDHSANKSICSSNQMAPVAQFHQQQQLNSVTSMSINQNPNKLMIQELPDAVDMVKLEYEGQRRVFVPGYLTSADILRNMLLNSVSQPNNSSPSAMSTTVSRKSTSSLAANPIRVQVKKQPLTLKEKLLLQQQQQQQSGSNFDSYQEPDPFQNYQMEPNYVSVEQRTNRPMMTNMMAKSPEKNFTPINMPPPQQQQLYSQVNSVQNNMRTNQENTRIMMNDKHQANFRTSKGSDFDTNTILNTSASLSMNDLKLSKRLIEIDIDNEFDSQLRQKKIPDKPNDLEFVASSTPKTRNKFPLQLHLDDQNFEIIPNKQPSPPSQLQHKSKNKQQQSPPPPPVPPKSFSQHLIEFEAPSNKIVDHYAVSYILNQDKQSNNQENSNQAQNQNKNGKPQNSTTQNNFRTDSNRNISKRTNIPQQVVSGSFDPNDFDSFDEEENNAISNDSLLKRGRNHSNRNQLNNSNSLPFPTKPVSSSSHVQVESIEKIRERAYQQQNMVQFDPDDFDSFNEEDQLCNERKLNNEFREAEKETVNLPVAKERKEDSYRHENEREKSRDTFLQNKQKLEAIFKSNQYASSPNNEVNEKVDSNVDSQLNKLEPLNNNRESNNYCDSNDYKHENFPATTPTKKANKFIRSALDRISTGRIKARSRSQKPPKPDENSIDPSLDVADRSLSIPPSKLFVDDEQTNDECYESGVDAKSIEQMKQFVNRGDSQQKRSIINDKSKANYNTLPANISASNKTSDGSNNNGGGGIIANMKTLHLMTKMQHEFEEKQKKRKTRREQKLLEQKRLHESKSNSDLKNSQMTPKTERKFLSSIMNTLFSSVASINLKENYETNPASNDLQRNQHKRNSLRKLKAKDRAKKQSEEDYDEQYHSDSGCSSSLKRANSHSNFCDENQSDSEFCKIQNKKAYECEDTLPQIDSLSQPMLPVLAPQLDYDSNQAARFGKIKNEIKNDFSNNLNDCNKENLMKQLKAQLDEEIKDRQIIEHKMNIINGGSNYDEAQTINDESYASNGYKGNAYCSTSSNGGGPQCAPNSFQRQQPVQQRQSRADKKSIDFDENRKMRSKSVTFLDDIDHDNDEMASAIIPNNDLPKIHLEVYKQNSAEISSSNYEDPSRDNHHNHHHYFPNPSDQLPKIDMQNAYQSNNINNNIPKPPPPTYNNNQFDYESDQFCDGKPQQSKGNFCKTFLCF